MAALRLAVGVLVAALVLSAPFWLDWIGYRYFVGSATRILILAIAAQSLNLILGYGGMVSFGHAAYLGVGAYVVAILSHHAYEGGTLFGLGGTVQALVAWPAAVLVSALVALVLGALCLRAAGVYFIMITLAFAQMLFFLFVSLEQYGGDDGLMMFARRNEFPGLNLNDDIVYYYVCLILCAAFFGLCLSLIKSRFGVVLRAVRQNEERLKALGCPTFRYKLAAFVIAGAGAGLAGALEANNTEFVSPDILHWTHSGELMIMVILGGIGTLSGPILGAAAVLLLEEFLPMAFDAAGMTLLKEHWRVVFGPLLIVLVLFTSRGLRGALADLLGRRA